MISSLSVWRRGSPGIYVVGNVNLRGGIPPSPARLEEGRRQYLDSAMAWDQNDAMTPATGSIRTPDQRLRVFVSSTLKELAPERRVVRAAIEGLLLAPVMFELGARPHPPRDLYRAYLEQSDVFVGLYAERYGWIAPGEEISGLEDEYRLAPAEMPKLVYIKDGADHEERLEALLDRIRDDDGTSYTYFTDIDELAELIRADLATLLAERFAVSAGAPVPQAVDGPAVALPSAFTPLVGRDRELGAVVDLLEGDARLITLTGSGGIGKSRLAIEAAAQVRDRFPGGVVFVDLAPVTDPALVLSAIAEALGVRDGMGRIEDLLRTALQDRRILLLVDNFEQVIDGAPVLRSLLQDAPLATALVTSRILLRVSGEHGMEIGPLVLPDLEREAAVEIDGPNPSVDLFVSSVRAAKPDFQLTPQNVVAIRKICVALDGVPLAIELAAAHARVLAPADLLDRLHRRLAVLAGGGRDLPERQRTMRAAIEWSVQLLPPSAHELLIRLGVFAGSFSLEAVEAIADDLDGGEVLSDLGDARRRQPRAAAGPGRPRPVHDALDRERVHPIRARCPPGCRGPARPARTVGGGVRRSRRVHAERSGSGQRHRAAR